MSDGSRAIVMFGVEFDRTTLVGLLVESKSIVAGSDRVGLPVKWQVYPEDRSMAHPSES